MNLNDCQHEHEQFLNKIDYYLIFSKTEKLSFYCQLAGVVPGYQGTWHYDLGEWKT